LRCGGLVQLGSQETAQLVGSLAPSDRQTVLRETGIREGVPESAHRIAHLEEIVLIVERDGSERLGRADAVRIVDRLSVPVLWDVERVK
jgi:hypothetical protein